MFSAPDAAELGHNRLVRRVERCRGQTAFLARNGTQLPVDLRIASTRKHAAAKDSPAPPPDKTRQEVGKRAEVDRALSH